MINAEKSHYLFANSQLPSAFQRGETHADRYETSAILAIDPSLVNEERRKALPCLPISLVDKLFKEKLNEATARLPLSIPPALKPYHPNCHR